MVEASLHQFLRGIPLFADLAPSDIDQLIAASRTIRVEAGAQLITEGDVGDSLIVILNGQCEVLKQVGDQQIVLALRTTGEFLGEMALIEQVPRTATVRATSPGEILEISAGAFQQMLQSSPQVAATILRTIAGRLRSTEASLMQREKLASLGTLAAGLAHELNNPSAAIQRSSAQLRDALGDLDGRVLTLASIGLEDAECQHLADLLKRPRARRSAHEAMDEEDRIAEVLEALGGSAAGEAALGFAALGWTERDLDELATGIAPARRTSVLDWVGTNLAARELAGEIERSARSVSYIVRAVKSYTYLDRAEVQDVDVMMSLEDTLMILKHKLREGITVTRDYAPDLKPIEAYGSEINQVWTNLIDNAIDAMGGTGSIEIHASSVGNHLEVRIANSGPAIPPDIGRRVFEPFFTTKPQGVGTGLGLHISRNIVVNRHGGEIDFVSVPGRTEFRVRLPQRLRG